LNLNLKLKKNTEDPPPYQKNTKSPPVYKRKVQEDKEQDGYIVQDETSSKYKPTPMQLYTPVNNTKEYYQPPQKKKKFKDF